MTAREAHHRARSWWTALDRTERLIRAALAAAAGFGVLVGAWAVVSGFLSLPRRVDAQEVRIRALEVHDQAQDSALEAHGGAVEYLVCDRLTSQGMRYHGRRTPEECAADIIIRGGR